MTSENSRSAKIEQLQEKIRKEAEEKRKEGKLALAVFMHDLANLLETDKLFISSSDLLRVYRKVIEEGEIEINGMRWPVSSLITGTSNAGSLAEMQ